MENSAKQTHIRQHGLALLLFSATLLLASTGWLLGTIDLGSAAMNEQRQSYQALQQARQALLHYALNYADDYNNGGAGPGHLPCPDLSDSGQFDSGSPAGVCAQFAIGRLPISWRTSGGKVSRIYPFAESHPRRFWYLPSEDFRFSSGQIVHPDTEAELHLDALDDIVAIIIDPGPPLSGQNRPSDDPRDYLEGENADGDAYFVSRADGPFNDRISYLSKRQLLPLVERRVLGYVRDWLQAYYQEHGHYPTPAALGDTDNRCDQDDRHSGWLAREQATSTCLSAPFEQPQNWFWRNRWQHYLYYQRAPNCAPGHPCHPAQLQVNGSAAHLLIASFGPAIHSAAKGAHAATQRRRRKSTQRIPRQPPLHPGTGIGATLRPRRPLPQ